MTQETITAAAISYQGEHYSVPVPGRHHNVFRLLDETFPGQAPFGDCVQGFLTSSGRFVDRKEGLAIATAAGQIAKKHGNPTILFSEDMW
jgi:hypothetical protein